eukprot:CAMPEP_0182569644 /NCGR_PEP_ID=MMETSP1324-20130603/10211_1 /TAXON_ID=236786 /ORGANISM="Florenciella sp., Strain RCC1587" /LENGTH=425 /DNA_ID=CAMNT_0024783945 /DNA_START=56 /DNA_END=1333 /DNA_ORIENTATION=+
MSALDTTSAAPSPPRSPTSALEAPAGGTPTKKVDFDVASATEAEASAPVHFTPTANIATPGAFAQPTSCKCMAALTEGGRLEPFTITRRALKPTDVAIQIKYAGVCHSDIHQARGEWSKGGVFPMVTGHEVGGVVAAVGDAVTKFSVGDVVGIGCMVDSCRSCKYCVRGDEQYCKGKGGAVFTYGDSTNKYEHSAEDEEVTNAVTYGGYSESVVVHEGFVCTIPSNLDLAAATPLLCAGVTTYSPLIHYGLRPHHKLAVVGLGGLGHMGVKFGVAMGAEVTVVSRGTGKMEDSKRLGAHHFLDSTDKEAMAVAADTFDFILDTVAANHDVGALLDLLTVDGKCVMVGIPPDAVPISAFKLIMGRKILAGSLIGGVRETQEMLDFCGRHDITCDIETIRADEVNEAWERAIASDVKYRFVIDTATL